MRDSCIFNAANFQQNVLVLGGTSNLINA